MIRRERCQYGLSSEEVLNLNEILEDFQNRIEFLEQGQDAQKKTSELHEYGLSILDSQLRPLMDLMVQQGKRLTSNEILLEQVVAATGKLRDANRQSESRIENMMLELQKQAESDRKHEQRFSKLEAGALDSGSGGSAPTGSGIQPEKRPCPFCGKMLSVKYLKRGEHAKKHCKKAAAAALQDEASAQLANESVAPELDLVISDVHSEADLFCIEEMPVVLQY